MPLDTDALHVFRCPIPYCPRCTEIIERWERQDRLDDEARAHGIPPGTSRRHAQAIAHGDDGDEMDDGFEDHQMIGDR